VSLTVRLGDSLVQMMNHESCMDHDPWRAANGDFRLLRNSARIRSYCSASIQSFSSSHRNPPRLQTQPWQPPPLSLRPSLFYISTEASRPPKTSTTLPITEPPVPITNTLASSPHSTRATSFPPWSHSSTPIRDWRRSMTPSRGASCEERR
jgi:hypothetical protein